MVTFSMMDLVSKDICLHINFNDNFLHLKEVLCEIVNGRMCICE